MTNPSYSLVLHFSPRPNRVGIVNGFLSAWNTKNHLPFLRFGRSGPGQVMSAERIESYLTGPVSTDGFNLSFRTSRAKKEVVALQFLFSAPDHADWFQYNYCVVDFFTNAIDQKEDGFSAQELAGLFISCSSASPIAFGYVSAEVELTWQVLKDIDRDAASSPLHSIFHWLTYVPSSFRSFVEKRSRERNLGILTLAECHDGGAVMGLDGGPPLDRAAHKQRVLHVSRELELIP